MNFCFRSSVTLAHRVGGAAETLLLSRPSLAFPLAGKAQITPPNRSLSTTNPQYLKEIVSTVEGSRTIVEAQYVKSPREGNVIKNELADKNVCILCALNLNLKHTDVMILSQFIRPDGRLLPKRVSGLCGPQQRKLTMLVTMAKKAGLLPNLAPANSHKDPTKRRGSKKLNRYFDDSTAGDTRLRNILRYNPNIGIRGTKIPEEEN